MDELIDILNPDLTVKKTCLKSYAHMHGLFHASVHIWFYNLNSELLLQKRANSKIAFPNLWDVSVAGHISSGEKLITAAIREIEEEIGLTVSESDLKFIGNFKEYFKHNDSFIDNEIHYIYLSQLNNKLSDLTIQKDELSDLRFININEFEKLTNNTLENNIVPHNKEYYKLIITEIKKDWHKKKSAKKSGLIIYINKTS